MIFPAALALSLAAVAQVQAQDVTALADIPLWAADQGAGMAHATARPADLVGVTPVMVFERDNVGGPGSFAIATPASAGGGFTHVSCQAHSFTYGANADPAAWTYECLGVRPGSPEVYARTLTRLGEGRRVEPWPNGETRRSANIWTRDPASTRGFLRGSVMLDGAEMPVWIVALSPAPEAP